MESLVERGSQGPGVALGLAEQQAALDGRQDGRCGQVDMALAVRDLVSEEAEFAHGTTLDIDGGLLAVRLP